MSDYLARLAERLTGAPAITPRPQARFESPAGGESIEESDEVAAGPSAPVAAMTVARKIAPAAPRPAVPRSVMPTAPVPSPRTAPGASRPPAPASLPVSETPVSRAPAPAAAVEHRTQRSLTAEMRTDGGAPVRSRVSEPATGTASVIREVQIVREVKGVAEAEPQAAKRPPIKDNRSAVSPQAPLPAGRNTRSPVARDRAVSPRESEAPPETPTIEISIGRIEVQAPPEAPAAPARTRHEPLLSLDAYLEQRRRGRR
jgi:hypothetical protein